MANETALMTDSATTSIRLLRAVLLATILCLSAAMHQVMWPAQPPDFSVYQVPWLEHLVRLGPLGAFASPFSNYSPPYLYLLGLASLVTPWLSPSDAIKALSVLLTAWLAFAAFRFAKAADASEPVLAGASVFLLPTVVLNSALLGQCDALWVAPLLLALAALLEDRPRTMLVWVGVAFAFKAQAAFIAPFVFAWLLDCRAPLHWWLIPVASYLGLLMPAWFAGWPLSDLLTIYLRQGQQLSTFISNASSLWSFGAILAPEAIQALIPVGFVLAAMACLGLIWGLRNRVGGRHQIVLAALFCSLFVPFILPKMHERYTLLADLIALVVAFAWRRPATLLMAALIQFGSLAATASYLFDRPSWVLAGSAAAGLALIMAALLSQRELAEPARA